MKAKTTSKLVIVELGDEVVPDFTSSPARRGWVVGIERRF